MFADQKKTKGKRMFKPLSLASTASKEERGNNPQIAINLDREESCGKKLWKNRWKKRREKLCSRFNCIRRGFYRVSCFSCVFKTDTNTDTNTDKYKTNTVKNNQPWPTILSILTQLFGNIGKCQMCTLYTVQCLTLADNKLPQFDEKV